MKKPYFSLIIPLALDRKAEVLDSISKLDYPKSQYEVIIERGTNPSRNRNVGAKKAKGEILCFLDDDAIVPKELLKEAKEIFGYRFPNPVMPKVDILGGPQLTPKDDKWFAKACGEVLGSKFGSLSMSKRYRQEEECYYADENSLTSCIMFVRKDAYKKIGGFNESLFPGEDPEFLARAKAKKCRIVYSPDIYIYHRRRPTVLKYCEQMFSYGEQRLKKEKSAKSEGKKGLMFYIPMAFALYIISLIFFNTNSLYQIPLLVYLVIAILFSVPTNRGFLTFLIMPFIFFLTHFMYGLGMLEGWFNNLDSNKDKGDLYEQL